MQAMKNSSKIEWTEVTKDKFRKLNSTFATKPVRLFPDFSEDAGRFVLETDWSKEAKALSSYKKIRTA